VNLRLPAQAEEQMAVAEVFDSRGKMLQTARLARWDNDLRGVVALDSYAAGLYLIRVKDGSQVFSIRVVKQ
ncbi:MAG: T9SS type A sorting domain-containing protein, partial [Saprospiraceae bacterium]